MEDVYVSKWKKSFQNTKKIKRVTYHSTAMSSMSLRKDERTAQLSVLETELQDSNCI